MKDPQMPPLKRRGDAAMILATLDGVAREVAALLLDDPSGATASEEAKDIAWAIRAWVDDNRRRAASRAPRVAALR